MALSIKNNLGFGAAVISPALRLCGNPLFAKVRCCSNRIGPVQRRSVYLLRADGPRHVPRSVSQASPEPNVRVRVTRDLLQQCSKATHKVTLYGSIASANSGPGAKPYVLTPLHRKRFAGWRCSPSPPPPQAHRIVQNGGWGNPYPLKRGHYYEAAHGFHYARHLIREW